MSKIGRKLIAIPQGVSVSITDHLVVCLGPKGKLEQTVPPELTVAIQQDKWIQVRRHNDHKKSRAFHGLYRSLIVNLVQGVSQGFSKTLNLKGTGYRAALEGNNLTLWLGFSHPIVFTIPTGITITVEKNTIVHVQGIDKELVGETAARIRRLRPVEPFKGRGIRYSDEIVRRKAGKTGTKVD